MERLDPRSPRLLFERLSENGLGAFYRLAVDPHVKRYLLDGATVTRAWCRDELARSDQLFGEIGVGLWLVRKKTPNTPAAPEGGPPIGFAGFRVFEEMSPEIQLLYGFVAAETGRGYATECGRAILHDGPRKPRSRFRGLLAAVDAPNLASIRVLEKLGFEPSGSTAGAFGEVRLFRWRRS